MAYISSLHSSGVLAMSSPVDRPYRGWRHWGRSPLGLAALAAAGDGSFCLMLDLMFGLEGAALHLSRLGPGFVFGLVLLLWAQASGVRLSRVWTLAGSVLVWACTYTLGLGAALGGLAGSFILLAMAGGAGALMVAGLVAVPADLRESWPVLLALVGAGALSGALGGTAFLWLQSSDAVSALAAPLRVMLLNGVLFLPWTWAMLRVLDWARNDDEAGPGGQSACRQ